MRTYTFNECYELLHVDPKTFRGWLKEAGIDPDHQVSRSDRRIRFLTEEQLRKLAEDHGRLLQGSAHDAEEAISPGAFKLLMDRMTRVEEEIARSSGRLEQESEHLSDLLEARASEYRLMLDERLAELALSWTNQSHDLLAQLLALESKVDQATEEQSTRLNHISTEQEADQGEIKHLQEQLKTQAIAQSEQTASLTNVVTQQSVIREQLATLQENQARDMVSLRSLVLKESEAVWLKLKEISSEASSRQTELVEIKSRSDTQELRLTELFRLIQDERGASEVGSAQKKVRSRPKKNQPMAEGQ